MLELVLQDWATRSPKKESSQEKQWQGHMEEESSCKELFPLHVHPISLSFYLPLVLRKIHAMQKKGQCSASELELIGR